MTRPSVLIFAGSDPSGGAGLQADIMAVASQGSHPLTVATALTVQDNDRVFSINPVAPELVRRQAQALIDKIDIAAVKIGIPGSLANARVIADLLTRLRSQQPGLPIVLDTVLASGNGNPLSADDAVQGIHVLLPLATIATPNLPEAATLCNGERRIDVQAERLLQLCPNVLLKGGHGTGSEVVNTWFARGEQRSWQWPRLDGEFHGSGCTLASAIAARLAHGCRMQESLVAAQAYVQEALEAAYAIAPGQRIPNRQIKQRETK